MSENADIETLRVVFEAEASQYNATVKQATETLQDAASVMEAELKDATAALTQQLQTQVATFGMSSRQAEIYRLKLKGASSEQLAGAVAADQFLSALDSQQKELQEAAAAQELLNQKNIAAKTATANYTKQLQTQVAAFGMDAREAEMFRMKLDGVTAEQLEAARAAAKTLSTLEAERQVLEKAKETVKQFQTPLQRFKERQDELNKMLQKGALDAGTYTRAMKAAKAELGTGWDRIAAAMRPAQTAGAEIARNIQAAGRSMSMYITAPLVGIGALSVREFATFENAMTKAFSKMGKLSADSKKAMNEATKQQSLTSNFSPTELAGGLEALAAAGMNAKQAIGALPAVDALATAGAFDLDTATRLLMDSQKALGMTSEDVNVNLSNAVKISDAMVKAGDQSTATVQQMAEATASSAEDARRWGMSLEEQMTLLVAYANTGNKGVAAGSDLARTTRLLGQSIRENKDVWKKAGIEPIDEATGEYKKMIPLLEEMQAKMAGMTGPQKGDFLSQLKIEALAQSAILPLVGQAATLQETLRGQMTKTGYTAEIAAQQHASFTNQMMEFLHTIQVVAGEIGEQLAPTIRMISNEMKSWLDYWRSLDKETKGYVIAIAAIVAAIGPLVVGLASAGLVVVQLKAGLVALGVAQAGATAGAVALNLAMLAAPVAVAAIGLELIGARTAYTELTEATAKATEMQKRHQAALANRSANTITAAGTGPDRKANLEKELEQAEKNMVGLANNVRTGKAEVDKLANAWRWPFATSNLTATQKGLKEYEENLKSGQKHVEALKKALNGEAATAEGGAAAADGGPSGDVLDPKNLALATEVEELTKRLTDQVNTFGMAAGEAEIYKLKLKGVKDAELEVAMAAIEMLKENEAVKKSEEQQKQIESKVKDMEQQASMVGKTAKELEAYKLAQDGATEAQIQRAQAAAGLIKSHEDEKKLIEDAKQITKQFQDPQVAFAERQTELGNMLDSGLISVETYTNALEDARKQMSKKYQIDLKATGVEAVEAGSQEALALLHNYGKAQEKLAKNDKAIKAAGGGKVKPGGVPGVEANPDRAKMEAQAAAAAGGDKSRVEALLAQIVTNTGRLGTPFVLKPVGLRNA